MKNTKKELVLLAEVLWLVACSAGCGTLHPDSQRSEPWNMPQAWEHPNWVGFRPWNASPRGVVDMPGFPWGLFSMPALPAGCLSLP